MDKTGKKYALVSIEFPSGKLHGLYSPATKNFRGTVLHIHGTGGNFYFNPFIDPLRGAYHKNGYDYFTVNFPGHDNTVVHENFEDSNRAIDAWIGRMKGGPVILQGHSLGTLKILNYLEKSDPDKIKRIKAIVLLSPFEIVAFYSQYNGKPHDFVRKELDNLYVNHCDESDYVPRYIFDKWPISIRTFKNAIEENGIMDRFPARNDLRNCSIFRLRIPVFIALGSSDDYLYPPAETVYDMIRNKQNNIACCLIKGAPHNFEGKIDGLVKNVESWLKTIDQ